MNRKALLATASLPLLLFVGWVLLFGGGPGQSCTGCGCPQSSYTSAVAASSTVFSYALNSPQYLSAYNVHWTGDYEQTSSPFFSMDGVELTGNP